MDILNDIFNTLNLKGALYFRTNFHEPWGVTVPKYEQAARFHLVVQGNCLVKVSGCEPVKLNAGDLILIPGGASHVLAHNSSSDTPELETVLENTNYTGNGVLAIGEGDSTASTQLICGHFNFRNHANHPILSSLPKHIVFSSSCRAKNLLLDELLRMITQRVFSDQLGTESSVIRLSEIVFIEILKLGIERSDGYKSVIDAFSDPQISQSLQLIHEQPEYSWTVERLASSVAMSRSRFSDRFSQLVGIGPMSYLSDWRLQKALALLDSSQMSVQQIANQTGYQSSSSFTRAFSGKFGVAPTEYRQTTH